MGVIEIKHYDVFIDLDFDGLSYEGNEKIGLSAKGDLSIDCEGLSVRWVRLGGVDANWELKGDTLHVRCTEFSGEVEIGFRGGIPPDSIVGIYTAPYEGGRIVTTQFEAIYARRFIPCFDNPAYKARFRLSVRVREGLKVVSNMPPELVESAGGKLTYRFKESPPMPTYLLYLGVGEFSEHHDDTDDPKLILVCAPGRETKVSYPLRVGRRVVAHFNDYFGVPYPLPKLHFIAVPGSSVGGMENWGAITYGEIFLLASDDSPVEQRIGSAEIIAHEVAHQWFGDLVTMRWWDDLWLNESFATIMSYKAVGKLFPEWDAQALFVHNEMGDGLFADSLSTTHPIQASVKEAHEIESIFDRISYSKGASILRMLEAYIGEENFRRGVQSYLKKHSYSSTVGSDFWGELSNASGQDVGALAAEWITSDGYPLIHVEVEGRRLRLRQERFTLTPNTSGHVYTVPLTLEVNGKQTPLLLKECERTLEFEREIDSVKLNTNRSGFYRVHYQDLSRVAPMNNLERGGLADDYYNLFLAQRIGLEEYKTAVEHALHGELNYLPTWEASKQSWELSTINPKYEELARDTHRRLLRAWLNRQGDMSKLTRASIAERLCRLDEDYALGLASLYAEYELAPQELRQAVVYAYAQTQADFDELLRRYTQTSDPEEKTRFLRGLASIRSEECFNNLLRLALEGTLKGRDGWLVISLTASNPTQRHALLKALQSSYNTFEQYSEKLTGHGWAVARALVEPLSREAATRPKEVVEVVQRMRRKETEREAREILELMGVYSKL
ncbi:MAG: M1 family metallopeptidase [Thermoprotei archaeon]